MGPRLKKGILSISKRHRNRTANEDLMHQFSQLQQIRNTEVRNANAYAHCSENSLISNEFSCMSNQPSQPVSGSTHNEFNFEGSFWSGATVSDSFELSTPDYQTDDQCANLDSTCKSGKEGNESELPHDIGEENVSTPAELHDDKEVWFDAADFGTLHFDCDVCIRCVCVGCNVCFHNDVSCVHCDKCLAAGSDDESINGRDDLSFTPKVPYSSDSDSDIENKNDDQLSDAKRKNLELRKDLFELAVQFKVSHAVMRSFLHILRKHGIGTLPKDPRTLLKTPRTTVCQPLGPGEYWHCGLASQLSAFIERRSLIENPVKLSFNVDGLPLANSSNSTLWPILCCPVGSSFVFMVGAYHGNEKPCDANDFLSDFVKKFVDICNNGLNCNGKVFKVVLESMVCDAPAKSFVLKTKGHNAYFGCTKCCQRGLMIQRRMTYPEVNARLKTDYGFVEQEVGQYHTGYSILNEIPNFGLVTNVPLDYMHLICLGVFRKMMYMFLSGPLKARIGAFQVQQLTNTLLGIVPYVPCEFARKPRSMQFVKKFKATEYRQMLLYTGVVALKDVLRVEHYEHFLALHVAISVLIREDLCLDYADYAKSLLVYFVLSFKILFGDEYISHNVHNLVHIADDVKKFGPLDRCMSAFPHENYLQGLKNLVRKGERPLQQIVRRYKEIESRNIEGYKGTKINSPIFSSPHSEGPLLPGCCNPQYRVCEMAGMTFKIKSEANNCCILADRSVVHIMNFATSTSDKTPMIVGRRFRKLEDMYSTPCSSAVLNIHYDSNLSKIASWPALTLSKKCFKMPLRSGFAVFPLLHSGASQ